MSGPQPLSVKRAQRWNTRELLTRIYDRIEREGVRPIWISIVPREVALQRAESARGPLAGVPFAVKDNIDAAGMQTTAGCPEFAYIAGRSATVVDRLEAAGAILIGKTNMDQFATGLAGTRTPYGACSSVFGDEWISGGSSSGSALAVAKGLVTFALGTDTAGSGRVPAAMNGITGLKPTRGAISAAGVVPACKSLDCISIFAGPACDAAKVFRAARGVDDADSYSREWLGASGCVEKIGVPRMEELDFFGDELAAGAWKRAVSELTAATVELSIAPFLEAAKLLYQGPWVAERYAAIGEFLEAHEAVDPTVRSIVLKGREWSAADAFRAEYRLRELIAQTRSIWQRIDALLLPAIPTTFTHEQIREKPIERNSVLGTYTNFVNLMDLAAVALPGPLRSDGLPFGLQIIGPAFSDESLLAAAARMEREPTMEIAVVGAHLAGQPLNWQLTERGARWKRTARTAAAYRLYALSGTKPEKPGLVWSPGFEGPGIELEIWEMPVSEAGSFLALVPRPLAIGTIQLQDRGSVQGFLCEAWAVEGMEDITALGGWRAYRALSR